MFAIIKDMFYLEAITISFSADFQWPVLHHVYYGDRLSFTCMSNINPFHSPSSLTELFKIKLE